MEKEAKSKDNKDKGTKDVKDKGDKGVKEKDKKLDPKSSRGNEKSPKGKIDDIKVRTQSRSM